MVCVYFAWTKNNGLVVRLKMISCSNVCTGVSSTTTHKESFMIVPEDIGLKLLTSSTFPVVLSFQQKWIRESSDCWMYTVPLRLSGVTTFPFKVILPARNSTRYLLELPLEPLTKLGKRAPDDIFRSLLETRLNTEGKEKGVRITKAYKHLTVAWLLLIWVTKQQTAGNELGYLALWDHFYCTEHQNYLYNLWTDRNAPVL